MKFFAVIFCVMFFFLPPVFSQSRTVEEQRFDTLRYGTETEIAALIQSLKTENTDTMDAELITLADTSRNRNILTGIFSFFAERGKSGLEKRAVKALDERDDEANETVLAAIDYLGKLKASGSIISLQKIVDGDERRFMSAAFKALGQAGSVSKEAGAEAAEFLVDYYNNHNPADDQRREIIAAIGETLSSEGQPFLTSLIKNQDERMVLRIAALEALAKIKDPEGLEAILQAVPAADPNVRAAAVGALGPFSGEAVDNAIFEAFRDSYYKTRLAAATAAKERKLAGAVPFLRYRAERDEVPQVKDEAIRALGAIGNAEALETLNALFTERKNSDRVRIIAAEMLIQDDAGKYAPVVITEMDEAKSKNQTALYNGLLKGLSVAKSPNVVDFARRLFGSASVVEKSYALDLCANNELKELAAEVRALTDEKNGGALSRKARMTLQRLGLSE
ncbi:PBS lyase [Spirochaetia bacterium]|nr:PBS lyase [Spirochaetia bacterium]